MSNVDDPFISAIYEAALEPERWESLFVQLSKEFGGAAIYLGQAPTDRFGAGDFWTFGVDSGKWDCFANPEQSAQTNLTLARLLRYEGRVVDRRVIIPDAEVGCNPLSRTFLIEQGLYHAAISVVHRDEDVASTFWVGNDRAHPVEGALIERLRLIAPHIGRAMRMHRALRQLEHEAATFRSVLEALDHGTMLLDETLRLLYANPMGESALVADRGLRLRFGRLFAQAPHTQQAIEALAWQMTNRRGDMEGESLLVSNKRGEPSWRLTLAPAIGVSTIGLRHGARIIAFVDDLARDLNGPEPATLEKLLGLTPAEARVAALSARTLRPAEIAAALSISINTVKSHLKVVYSQLEVNTQAELVRKILTLREC